MKCSPYSCDGGAGRICWLHNYGSQRTWISHGFNANASWYVLHREVELVNGAFTFQSKDSAVSAAVIDALFLM